MNNFFAEIVADSINPMGDRITTMKLTYPRIIHAELMTHRMFSRNAASSRAVPAKKMIQMVKDNLFVPLAIQKEHKGMQGTEYFTGTQEYQAQQLWVNAAESALFHSEQMRKFGFTKQLSNRVLEPYQYYQVLVTATEWDNFFNLRCPQYRVGGKGDIKSSTSLYKTKKDAIKDYPNSFDESDINWLYWNESQAEIHIQAIAELMSDAYNESTPKQLQAGEWHIPFGDNMTGLHLLPYELAPASTTEEFINKLKVKIATARCARISYQTLGDDPKIDYESDIRLHDVLVSNGHASPLEHCTRAMTMDEYVSNISGTPDLQEFINEDDFGIAYHKVYQDNPEAGWCRNFKGFIQYRHLVENGHYNN